MPSDLQTLQALANSIDTDQLSQVGVTRTRASLLSIKKLTDTLRKDLLLKGKMIKDERKKSVSFVSVPSEKSDSSPISNDDETDIIIDLSEPLLPNAPKPPTLKREPTKRTRKVKP